MQFLGGQVFIIFPGAQFLQVFVELVLHTLQGTFFFDEAYFFLFNGRFFCSDLRFQPDLFIVLGILLFVQVFVGDIESFKRGFAEKVLAESTARNVVDQPIKATDVPGGKASVAMLRRTKPEVSALIHNDVTETYYILSGSGTLVTGGSLGTPKPTDLTRVNAGMSQTGTRVGGDSKKVKPGDIIIIPAGTPHSFSELDAPISYLVYRFEPAKR